MDKLIGGGQKVDLVLIDPPYNINKESAWDNRKKEEYVDLFMMIIGWMSIQECIIIVLSFLVKEVCWNEFF